MTEEARIQLFGPAPPAVERRKSWPPKLNATVEAQETANLRAYWQVIAKRRWTILAVMLAVFTLVLIGTLKEKPVYEARALLEIEQENPNVVTVQQLFQVENVTDDYLETQYRILQSDSLAERVIGQLHLDQMDAFNPPKRVWPWQERTVAASDGAPANETPRQKQAVLARFEERLSVNPVQRSRLVRVSFDSVDPQLAAKIVNALAANYIQENLQTHWEATQKASAWLSEQLDGMKIKLEKSEDALQQYAQANGLLFLESNAGNAENIVDERLRELQDELTQAQAARYQWESLDHLAQGGDYASLPGVFDNKLIDALSTELADLERQEAELAANFKPGYPKMEQVDNQIKRLENLIWQQRVQAASHIHDEYLAAARQESLVQQAFDAQRQQANRVAQASVEYNILKREAESDKQVYEGLLQRLKEAGISAGLKASNVRIVDAAAIPASPVKPRVAFNMLLGLSLGLGCGLGVAFLWERADSTLKSPDDIEQFLRLPALAMIPLRHELSRRKNGAEMLGPELRLDSSEAGGAERVGSLGNGWIRVDAKSLEHSVLSEAFRSLRTSVLLSTAGRPPRSLVFLSADGDEGKTTICGNLAISLAQLGKKVLVIDADMRKPNLHEFFHRAAGAGLVNYLAGEENWRPLVQESVLKGLDCLPCGPEPPNPNELLSSERMETLLRESTNEYNFVLLDSPPLLDYSDGRILTRLAEGAVLIVRGGATSRELVQRAQACVADVGARLIGVVLNALELPRHGYSYRSHAN